PKAPATPASVRCYHCGITVHTRCLAGAGCSGASTGGGPWTCTACALGQEEVEARCALCPRRGGLLQRTHDSRWVHAFCAAHMPGKVRVGGRVDVRGVPKDCKGNKCTICNRKHGATLRCQLDTCNVHMHPLCAARGQGLVWRRGPSQELFVYCADHIPEGIERLPSGHWADGLELDRLKHALDRARTILGVMMRREKLKKQFCQAGSDLLLARFSASTHKLARARGRRERAAGMGEGEGAEGEGEGSSSDSETSYESDSSGSGQSLASGEDPPCPGDFLPLPPNEPPRLMECSDGDMVGVGGSWRRKKK
ncbi:PHD-zinc-finger like domain-containing protein, partial [Ochromonadaceae sp. CCMP2298]